MACKGLSVFPTNCLHPQVSSHVSAGWWPEVLRAATCQTRINMNITKYSKTLVALVADVFAVALVSEAQAGPGPQQIYRPVMTMTAAQQLPVGSKIAFSCNNGGPVTVVTVDKERSYLKGFTCPVSKRVYRFSPGGGGRTADQFVYQAKGGYTAHLLTLGKL